ncbi:RNA polymerase sigma factor SigW [Halalkalibacillus sediminis]|uniref:RNA polymerase sigma factor SigW n=1 Tax=Halalkalibacillus sediminis TaxID=2018042 RepID=A0A2I0QTC7_9BACI|nr:RNA polymerase sigma factor SigW [Halalkalibacillus sediminis]PKR77554.1 RNA polymerase sigma factor SigW [Halalkalibacillus sediminis]
MDFWLSQQIKQIKKGNNEAFGELIDLYQQKIYQHCYRMLGNHHDAQEIAQETFFKAYKNIHTFKKQKKFSPWLYRIATNLAIDYMRKKKPISILDNEIKGSEQLTMLDQIESNEPSPDQAFEKKATNEELQYHLLQLPEKYRAVIVLRYIQELSLQEIADILDLPLGTVKTQIHRGRDVLKKILHESVRS